MVKAKAQISQETINLIVDAAVSKGINLDDHIEEGLPIEELTEEDGQALLKKLQDFSVEKEAIYLDADVSEIRETLKVPLTDADYKDIAIKIGQAGAEITKAEDDLAAVKSQFKAKIDGATARRNELSAMINAGCEYKPVTCHLIKNYRENSITKIRLDTGEIVSQRTMNVEERQRGLWTPEPAAPEPEAEAAS